MLKRHVFLALCLLLLCGAATFAADVILNEYNAVGPSELLKDSGADTYWERIPGNGGDWFELVVITDQLDMREWGFEISWFDTEAQARDSEVLWLTDNEIWSSVRSGTIITISEELADDVSYAPDSLDGDWWINVQASATGSGIYVENQNFPVNNNEWQLIIRDILGTTIFGPAGEGVVLGAPGIGNDEVFRLQADPSVLIGPDSGDYSDGNISTFGAPNQWGISVQDFTALRSVVPEPGSFLLLAFGGLALMRKPKLANAQPFLK